jgi:hypothetical protein
MELWAMAMSCEVLPAVMNKMQKYFLLFLFDQSFIPFPKNIYIIST